jgi:FkbM family methyltransferase
MSEPFGALSPSPAQERVRALAHRLPATWFGRKAASLLLGPAGGRSRRAFDVTAFGSQKARLHPYDNICEKRVFLTPKLWDPAERALLSDFISTFGGRTFHFVDVGANVGLYTLFARAEAMRAGARLKAVCVDADPEMATRLKFNIAASQAQADVEIFECAASGTEGTLAFAINRASRGLSRIDPAGAHIVRARPLLGIVEEAKIESIDAMKIDVEGHEAQVVRAFLKEAPPSLRPALVILETSHAGDDPGAQAAFIDAGYAVRLKTRRNAVLVRADQSFL